MEILYNIMDLEHGIQRSLRIKIVGLVQENGHCCDVHYKPFTRSYKLTLLQEISRVGVVRPERNIDHSTGNLEKRFEWLHSDVSVGHGEYQPHSP